MSSDALTFINAFALRHFKNINNFHFLKLMFLFILGLLVSKMFFEVTSLNTEKKSENRTQKMWLKFNIT